jgi:hypothetical protein
MMKYPEDGTMKATEVDQLIDRITSQIFMGSGNFSLAEMGYLYSRLHDAFDILGGIQQVPHCTDSKEVWEQHEEDYADGAYEVEKIAKEIYLALTGKRVPFIETKKVPK